MSVVIAIKEKNSIIMGCDSQVTIGQLKDRLSKDHNKIFKIKNCKHGLMGVVGFCRDSQLLSVQDNLIDKLHILENKIDYDYVVKNLYSDIYKVLLDNNRIDKDSNGNNVNYTNNHYIFAFKDSAWLICCDGTVFEIDDYLVTGSGEEIAIGVLENNKGKSAEERIKEAIKSCSDKTIYVDNKVVIKSTKE